MALTKRANPTREDLLASRPTRLVDAVPTSAGEGKWRLQIEVKPARWATWLLRVSSGVKRTFELDALGKNVWDACDGKASIAQIIRKLAEEFRLNQRETEVATLAFLNTLGRKGLIGFVKEPRDDDRETES